MSASLGDKGADENLPTCVSAIVGVAGCQRMILFVFPSSLG